MVASRDRVKAGFVELFTVAACLLSSLVDAHEVVRMTITMLRLSIIQVIKHEIFVVIDEHLRFALVHCVLRAPEGLHRALPLPLGVLFVG